MPRIYVQGYLQRRASALDRRHHTTAIKTFCLSGPAATRPPAAMMLAENEEADVLIAAAPALYAHAAESELRRPEDLFQSPCQQILHYSRSPVVIAWSISMGHEVFGRIGNHVPPAVSASVSEGSVSARPGRSQFVFCSVSNSPIICRTNPSLEFSLQSCIGSKCQ